MYDYRGHLIINHPGLIDGFQSMVTLVPDEHYGIAILSNLGDNDGIIPEMAGVLSRAIVDELLGLTANDLNAVVLGQRRQAQETAKKQREEREAKRRRDTTPSLAPHGLCRRVRARGLWHSAGSRRCREVGTRLEQLAALVGALRVR